MKLTQEGHGPVVVLSHALALDHHMWDEVSAALAKHYTVARYDHRGHGQTPTPDQPFSIDDLPDDAATVVRSVSSRPVVFAGLSLGGYAQPGYADTMQRVMCLQDMDLRGANMITEAQYRSIKAPTLVVWTSHDPTATPAEGKQIADMIPDSRYVVMNECGHWPQYENADEFNRLHIDSCWETARAERVQK